MARPNDAQLEKVFPPLDWTSGRTWLRYVGLGLVSTTGLTAILTAPRYVLGALGRSDDYFASSVGMVLAIAVVVAAGGVLYRAVGLNSPGHGYVVLNLITRTKVDVWLIALWAVLVQLAACNLDLAMLALTFPDLGFDLGFLGAVSITMVWLLPPFVKILASRPQ